jgi:hypothetical protein
MNRTGTKPVKRHPRRIKLIKPRLQFKLIGSFVGLMALALALQFLVLSARLSEAAAGMPTGGADLTRELPYLLGGVLVFSFCVLLPAGALIGILITFRIAGPAWRFERHLGAVARGEDPGPCRIRKGDEFQELCGLINAALEARGSAASVERGPDEAQRKPARLSA